MNIDNFSKPKRKIPWLVRRIKVKIMKWVAEKTQKDDKNIEIMYEE